MKKITALAAMAALIATALTGCASTNESSVSTPDTSVSTAESTPADSTSQDDSQTSAADTKESEAAGDLQSVYDKIMAQQPAENDIIMFPESSEDLINGYYPGLSDIEFKDFLLFMPPVTGNACEILLVEAADSAGADKTEQIMQARVDQAASDTVYPDVAEVWAKNAKVERDGNRVCMIVLPNDCVVPDNVFAL